MYAIKVTPTNKAFKPHIWKEGGEFQTVKSAEFQAKQLRKMKAIFGKGKQYANVEVLPVIGETYSALTRKDINDTVKDGYVVFYGIKWDTDGHKVKLPKAVKVLKEKFDSDFDFSLEGANYLSDQYEYCIHSFNFKK